MTASRSWRRLVRHRHESELRDGSASLFSFGRQRIKSSLTSINSGHRSGDGSLHYDTRFGLQNVEAVTRCEASVNEARL